MHVHSGLNAGLILLGVGPIMVQGADYSWTGGKLPTLNALAPHSVVVFHSLASRTSAFSPDVYYNLALGTVGAGICPEFAKANDAKGCLIQPPRVAVPHFRPAMQPGGSFNWGRVKPTFNFGGNHFYLPTKSSTLAQAAGGTQPGLLNGSAVPILDEKITAPKQIIDDPKNALEHRLP